MLDSTAVAAFDATHTSKEQTDSGSKATVTISIATPGVVTWNSHGLSNGAAVRFLTTGALPTGLTAGTIYYVVNSATNTFQVSATPGGSAINTSGTQSGTNTAYAEGSHEVYGNGWAIGGLQLTTVAVSIRSTNGAALTADDVVATATGGDIGPAYGYVLYDATSMKPLWLVDFGQSQTAGQETDFKIVFDPSGTRGTIFTVA